MSIIEVVLVNTRQTSMLKTESKSLLRLPIDISSPLFTNPRILGGYFLYYSMDFPGDSSELGKGAPGCAQLDDMADSAEIPGAAYPGFTGTG